MFKIKSTKKVIVGMSGGVDSSVAAYLLQQQGYYVEGLFMKNWEEDDNENDCTFITDLADAQEVCNRLNIKLHVVNFAAEYWEYVFEPFLSEYNTGELTPNPDILCNKEIKFKLFLEYAIEDLGADYIATGHYVRQTNTDGQNRLLRAHDKQKDQSYFLYALNCKQIAKSIFPIGDLKKLEVRRIAKQLKLVTAEKKDSTGICFIGERNFSKFLGHYLSSTPGKIITTDGNILGKHQGLIYYTIGQRKGLGIGGIKGGNGSPWYVADKNIENNLLIIAQGRNHPCLMSVGFIAQQLNWIDYNLISDVMSCTVKIRYRQIDVPCTIVNLNKDCIRVYFNKPISAVTPGQSAVFYDGEICLGGGVIKQKLSLLER